MLNRLNLDLDEFGETNSNAEDPKDLITPANTIPNEDSDTFTKLLQKESNRSRLSIGEKLDVIDRFAINRNDP